MPRLFLSLVFFVCILCSPGQDLTSNAAAAEKIKTLYNQKKYAGIYLLLGSEAKTTMSEKEFVEFMQSSVYLKNGPCEKVVHFKDSGEQSDFIGYFSGGELLITLTTKKGWIEFLQFLPYDSPLKTKISSYASDNPKQNQLDSLVDKTVADFMTSPQNCGLSIAIYARNQEHFYNYGETKRDTKNLPARETIYEIGSITAAFAGVLLAQAVIEKKVKATDDITMYLPKDKFKNLASANAPIQLIHLANHTSGLPAVPSNLKDGDFDPFNPYAHYTREMLFGYLATIVPGTLPGTRCEYSNVGIALLGIILENVYNKPFEQLVKDKISDPAGMKNTGINLIQKSLMATSNNAAGNETPHWELPAVPAAGAIRSTPKDMLLFAKKNLEEKDPACKLSHEETFNDGTHIGMAWQILKTRLGNTLTWHNGATYGSAAFCGFIKEKNCAVVVLANSATPVDMIALAILKFLQQEH